MSKRLGVLTIGEAPRADDTVGELRQVLGPSYAIVERGALDGLTRGDIAELAPRPDEYVLITLLADGTSITLGKPRILALLQQQIDAFAGDGVDAILLLCTGTFPEFKSERLIVQPQPVLYHLVLGLAGSRRTIGVLTPLPEQIGQARDKWREYGVDPVVAAASPYVEGDEVTPAVWDVAERGADLVFMDCMGYSLPMKARARAAARGRPIILARSAVARVLAEIAE